MRADDLIEEEVAAGEVRAKAREIERAAEAIVTANWRRTTAKSTGELPNDADEAGYKNEPFHATRNEKLEDFEVLALG